MVGNKTILGIFVVVLAYYFSKTSSKVKLEGKIVETESGSVKGIISKSRDGRDFYEWLGIHYATADRFNSPQPVKKWSGVKDASNYGATCAQLDLLLDVLTGEEDCLFLNIHVPKDIPKETLLPVLFWIHGGYFAGGNSDLYRPEYWMDEDIVVVTINYRLGALGFLSTGADGLIRGNMGLKDQAMALKWVKKNIEKFQGDSSNIVVSGESAGGASSHFHLVSPMSRGLMSKVISQSGSVLNDWAIYENPAEQAKEFSSSLSCPVDDPKKMVECLKNLPLSNLLDAHRPGLEIFHSKSKVFVPTIESIVDEETFLAQSPLKLIKSQQFEKVPWLTGFNSEEGLISSHVFLKNETFREIIQEDWTAFAESFIMLSREERVYSKKIRDFYFGKGGRLDDLDAFDQVTNIITDRVFGLPIMKAAKLQAEHSPVYLYYYSKKGPSLFTILLSIEKKLPVILEILLSIAKSWINTNILGLSAKHYGSCHSDDLASMWIMPNIFDVSRDDPYYEFSKEVTKLWVDFAKDESSMRFRNIPFEKLDIKDEMKFFEIGDVAGSREPDDRLKEAIQFWNSIAQD